MGQIVATYINHMGDDLTVCNAARVSFGKESKWEMSLEWDDEESDFYWDRSLNGRDAKLIRYLAKHGHYSPFGHCFMSFHVKAPVFVRAQLVKHKFLRLNEISRRYVDDEPEFYTGVTWRERSEDKKQGSGDNIGPSDLNEIQYTYEDTLEACLDEYNHLLTMGVAPEQARMVLPQSMMTEWYWSGSLDAFAAMCNLRLKEDAQYESRLVAQQIDEKASQLFPHSWKALVHESS